MVDKLQEAFEKLSQSPLTRMRDECQQVPNSPEDLVSFFSKHIGGMNDSQFFVSTLHAQACEGALTKLRVFVGNDAQLAATVADLERQFVAKQRQRQLKRYALFVGAPAAFLLLMLILGIVAVGVTTYERAIRNDIQTMVQEGRFDEARIRAENLSGTNEVRRTLESIDKAERAGKEKDTARRSR